MKYAFRFLPFFLIFLLCSCRSIDLSGSQFYLPPSRVYLSFDDGPNDQGDITAHLLDILKKYQIRALFCLLGENAERSPQLVRRIHDEGHYIMNHGYADKWACLMDNDEFKENLVRGEEVISGTLGFKMSPMLYRFHGGFYNSEQEKIVRDAGFTVVPTTIRVYDASKDSRERHKVVREIIEKAKKGNGGVIILHDTRGSNSRAERKVKKKPQGKFNRSWILGVVDEIIPLLLDEGFIIDNPDTLLRLLTD